MYTITVLGVSEAVRVAVLRETGKLPGTFTVTIDKDHPLWNDAVDMFGTKLQHQIGSNEHTFEEVPTADNVIALLKRKAAEQQAENAKRKAEYEALVEAALAAPAMELLRSSSYSNSPASENIKWRIYIDGSMYFDGNIHHVKDDKRLQPRIAELTAMVEAQNKRIDAIEMAAAEAKRSEMETWIKEHGSNRLKRSLEEGIKCQSLYLEERIAKELPGWVYYTDVPGTTSDPINPTDDDFALLDEAREMLPDSELQWYKGGDGKGMVVEGEFLGQGVLYGHDAINSDEDEES